MTDVNNDEVEIIKSPLSVGEQLKLAREAKKITVAEVAAQLRLTQDMVKSLENEQWENLHGRAYARGYFLSYVKFLGLPEHDMLTAFNIEYKTAENYAASSNMLENKRSFPWLPLILVVLVTCVMWFAYQQWKNVEVIEEGVESQSSWDQLSEQENKEDVFSNSVVKPFAETNETNLDSEMNSVDSQETEF